MKKKIFGILVIPFLATCSFATDNPLSDFSQYRSSPFQWVYPEYFFKAEIVSLETKRLPTESETQITFFGLSASIPKYYVKSAKKISQNTIFFHSTINNKEIFFISLNDEKSLLGSESARKKSKDFFSAFSSAEEFHHKVYTLTPNMIDETTPTGDLWMIHAKGMLFENTQRIRIIKEKFFSAYSRIFKNEYPRLTKDLVIFHTRLPPDKYISMGFRTHDNTPDLILSTLQ